MAIKTTHNAARNTFKALSLAMERPGKWQNVHCGDMKVNEVYEQLVPTIINYVESLGLLGFSIDEVGHGFFRIIYVKGGMENIWNVKFED